MNMLYSIYFSLYATLGDFNPLSVNIKKWSHTLKQFVGKLPTNCLSVFVHFVGLALKGLNESYFFKVTEETYRQMRIFLLNGLFLNSGNYPKILIKMISQSNIKLYLTASIKLK